MRNFVINFQVLYNHVVLIVGKQGQLLLKPIL